MSARKKFSNNFPAQELGGIQTACDRFDIRISKTYVPLRKKLRIDCTSSPERESINDTSDSSEDFHDVLRKNLNRTDDESMKDDGFARVQNMRILDTFSPLKQSISDFEDKYAMSFRGNFIFDDTVSSKSQFDRDNQISGPMTAVHAREMLPSHASRILPHTQSSSTQELSENVNESGTSDSHHHTSCCKACHDNIIVIKQQLNALTMLMMESQEGHTFQHADNVLPEFPISELEELINLNQLLTEDRTARLQFKQMIRKAGGQNLEKHVRNVLKIILVDSLADALSWTGQKNTICTKNMKFVELLIDSITETWPDGTISSVRNTIKSWLQHAGDRIRYEMKKFTT